MEIFFSVPKPPKYLHLGSSDTLGHMLLTDAQVNWYKSTDAHWHSSMLWQLDAEMWSVVPKKGAWSCHSLLRVCTASVMTHCKTNAECYFAFLHQLENPLWISFG